MKTKEKFPLKRKPKTCPLDQPIDELVLCYWQASVDNPQHLEIIKLARIGLWAKKNAAALTDALKLAAGELTVDKAQAYNDAMLTKPKELK